MRITHLGHSCLLVEDGDARVLLDPGVYSSGFAELTALTGVLVTHQHPDHLDQDALSGLLERNPDAALHSDPGSAERLAANGIQATAVHAGDVLDLGTRVEVLGELHAVIHPDVPVIPNRCYLVGGRFFHPGDSFTVPQAEVEILGVPAGAPWLKISEAVDFLRAVAPRTAIPIHDKVLAVPEMSFNLLRRLKPATTTFQVLDDGVPADF